MDIIFFLIVLTAAAYLLLTFVTLRSRKKHKTYRRFVGFLIFGTIWVISGALETSSLRQSPNLNLIFSKMDFAAAAMISYFVAIFSLHFPRESKKLTLTKELLLLFPILFVVALTFFGKIFFYDGDNLIYNYSQYFIYLGILTIYFIPISLGALLLKYRILKGIQKLQLKYVLFSYTFSVVVGLSASVFFAYNRHETYYFGIANISTLTFALCSFYAILRYRFLDIRIIIRKGLVQFLTFGTLFGIYTYIILFLQKAAKDSLDFSEGNTVLIAVLLIVITIEPLRRFIYRFIDKLFASKERADKEALQRLELISRSTMQFRSLVEKVSAELNKVLGCSTSFLLFDPQKNQLTSYPKGDLTIPSNDALSHELSKGTILITEELPYRIEEGEEGLGTILESLKAKGIALAMPLGSGDEFLGAYVFPDTKSSPTFTADSIKFLKNFGQQATLSFTSALAYKQAIERITK